MAALRGRALAVGLVATVLAGCTADAKKVDLTKPSAWLLPEEVETGRKYSLPGRSGIYFRSGPICIWRSPRVGTVNKPFSDSNDSPHDIISLISGSVSDGYAPPLIINFSAAFSENHRQYYKNDRNSYEPILFSSLYCRDGRNKAIMTPEMIAAFPQHIRVLIPHKSSDLARYLSEDRARRPARVFTLKSDGGAYCQVSQTYKGQFLDETWVVLLKPQRRLPRFGDVEDMDCILRGLIASVGYTGILQYRHEQIYDSVDLPSPANPQKSDYLGRLLWAFHAFMGKN